MAPSFKSNTKELKTFKDASIFLVVFFLEGVGVATGAPVFTFGDICPGFPLLAG